MINKEILDRKIDTSFTEANIPGMAVIAAHEGKIIYEHYAGYRHVKAGLPVTGETIFGVASLTKSVTAIAIMMLQDEGKLDVTDCVVKWLPELKRWNEFYKRNITIHHLLTHTAGLSGMNSFHLARRESVEQDPDGEYLLGEFNGDDHVNTVRDLISAMIKENVPFIAKPGEMFNYSNESYALLQEIVERASGESFVQFTTERIFERLGMKNAVYTFDDMDREAEVTELYAFTRDEAKQVFHSPSWWASGKIYSVGALKASAKDVQKYLELFRKNGHVHGVQLVSTHSMKQIKTAHITTPNGVQYGYGLIVDTIGTEPVVGHGGGVKGISSYMLTTDHIAVTVLTNIADVSAEQFAMFVLNAFHKETSQQLEADDDEAIVLLTEAELNRYVGHYATNERQSVDVTIEGNGLCLQLQNKLTAHVKPIGNNQFVLPDGKKITFIMDMENTIQGIFRGMRYIQKKGRTE